MLILVLLLWFTPIYCGETKQAVETTTTYPDLDPNDGAFVKSPSFIYIKRDTYSEIMKKLKELMPTLKVNAYLFLENFSNPHITRAFNDYIGTHFILGRVKAVHKDVLIWQRTDVMLGER